VVLACTLSVAFLTTLPHAPLTVTLTEWPPTVSEVVSTLRVALSPPEAEPSTVQANGMDQCRWLWFENEAIAPGKLSDRQVW